jgi:hypothetical protein
MSDHGEELVDHGALDHGHSLYDELIRVPLIFALSDSIPRGRRVAEHVRLVDLTPTVLDILGYEADTDFEGVSLEPLLGGLSLDEPGGSRLLAPGICYAEALRHRATTKSITTYPWKLIYDTQTKAKMLFNLMEDKGEKRNLALEEGAPVAAVEEVLFRTLIDISDTWFIELRAGDREHAFDLDITTGEPGKLNTFRLCRWIDADDRVIAIGDLGRVTQSHSRLTVRSVRTRRPLTLAFKVPRMDAPIRFDLRIDGEPATRQTFIGESLTGPADTPFTMRDSLSALASAGKPARSPAPPCFVVWRSTSRYGGETVVDLDEQTRQELRSLGYIQ